MSSSHCSDTGSPITTTHPLRIPVSSLSPPAMTEGAVPRTRPPLASPHGAPGSLPARPPSGEHAPSPGAASRTAAAEGGTGARGQGAGARRAPSPEGEADGRRRRGRMGAPHYSPARLPRGRLCVCTSSSRPRPLTDSPGAYAAHHSSRSPCGGSGRSEKEEERGARAGGGAEALGAPHSAGKPRGARPQAAGGHGEVRARSAPPEPQPPGGDAPRELPWAGRSSTLLQPPPPSPGPSPARPLLPPPLPPPPLARPPGACHRDGHRDWGARIG